MCACVVVCCGVCVMCLPSGEEEPDEGDEEQCLDDHVKRVEVDLLIRQTERERGGGGQSEEVTRAEGTRHTHTHTYTHTQRKSRALLCL